MTVCAALAHDVSENHHRVTTGNMKECLRCQEWVKPALGTSHRSSNKSNLPGIFGVVKSIACCPKCGEKV